MTRKQAPVAVKKPKRPYHRKPPALMQAPVETKEEELSVMIPPSVARGYMVACTDLVLSGVTLGRGQVFPVERFQRLTEKRQAQLRELHYIRDCAPSDDPIERCDKCTAEFVGGTYYLRHQAAVHVRGTISLDSATPRNAEDPRPPSKREAPVLSDADFEARIAV